MAWQTEVSPEFERDYRKRCKKDAVLRTAVDKKVAQILEQPLHDKPLRGPFKGVRRVHVARDQDDTAWEPDPLIRDERFLAAHVKGKGLVVFSACPHAGIVNVLEQALESFPGTPLHGALGGLHLAGIAPERIITPTGAALEGLGLRRLAPGHCTGRRAVRALAEALGEETVVPLAVGKTYTFQESVEVAAGARYFPDL